MKMKLILRGHHLLCIQGFQGYGYNKEFIHNMEKINEARKNDTTIIEVVNHPDDICRKCPNLIDNICKDFKNNEEIVSMDENVINKISQKREYNSKELFEEISRIFKTKENTKEICLDCSWWDKCLFVKNLENR